MLSRRLKTAIGWLFIYLCLSSSSSLLFFFVYTVVRSSEFLTIHVDCDVSVTPDLIEGDTDVGALRAGHYIGRLASESGRRGDVSVGQPINASARLARIVSIRPDRPFGVNSGSWSESVSHVNTRTAIEQVALLSQRGRAMLPVCQ